MKTRSKKPVRRRNRRSTFETTKGMLRANSMNNTNFRFKKRKSVKKLIKRRKSPRTKKEKPECKIHIEPFNEKIIEEFFNSSDCKPILHIISRYGIFNLRRNKELFLAFLKNKIGVMQMIRMMNFPDYYLKRASSIRSNTKKKMVRFGKVDRSDLEVEEKENGEEGEASFNIDSIYSIKNLQWTIKKSRILDKIRRVIHHKIKLRKKRRERLGSELDRTFANIEDAWLRKIENGNISSHGFKTNYFDKIDPLKHLRLKSTSVLTQVSARGKIVPKTMPMLKSHQRLFNSLTDKYMFVIQPNNPSISGAGYDRVKEWLKIEDLEGDQKDKKNAKQTISSFNKGDFESFLYIMKYKEKERKMKDYFKSLIMKNKNLTEEELKRMISYNKDFLDLELGLMLKDVLEFDPLDENQVNNLLESKEDENIVAICPRDWVRVKKSKLKRTKRVPCLNRKFKSSSVDRLGAKMDKFGYYEISRNKIKQRVKKPKRKRRITTHLQEIIKKRKEREIEEQDSSSSFDVPIKYDDEDEKSGVSCVSFTENQLNVLYKNSREIQTKMIRMRNKHKPWTETLKNLFELKTVNKQVKNIHLSKKMA